MYSIFLAISFSIFNGNINSDFESFNTTLKHLENLNKPHLTIKFASINKGLTEQKFLKNNIESEKVIEELDTISDLAIESEKDLDVSVTDAQSKELVKEKADTETESKDSFIDEITEDETIKKEFEEQFITENTPKDKELTDGSKGSLKDDDKTTKEEIQLDTTKIEVIETKEVHTEPQEITEKELIKKIKAEVGSIEKTQKQEEQKVKEEAKISAPQKPSIPLVPKPSTVRKEEGMDKKIKEILEAKAPKDKPKIENKKAKNDKEKKITDKEVKEKIEEEIKVKSLEEIKQIVADIKYYNQMLSKDFQEESDKKIPLIVPQKKTQENFVTSDVPYELKTSFRTRSNRHIPNFLSEQDKIDMFFYSIYKNNTDKIRSFTGYFSNINLLKKYGETSLTYATLIERHSAMRALLFEGADINQKNDLQQAPLHIAIKHSDLKGAAILIKNKADLNTIDGLKRTPLMYSVANENKEITYILLESGVKVNNKDYKGQTALDMAKINNDSDIEKLLIEYGAK